jgi:tetratricopeptide (TPR) repeat protein
MDFDTNPEISTIWNEAKAAIERGDYDKAIETYKYTLVRYGDNPTAVEYANAYLGDLYLTLKQLKLSETHIKKAISCNLANPHYHYVLGFIYSTQSWWKKSVQEFETAVKKILSVSYWAMAPPSIVMMLLAILFMYVRDPDTLELNPAKNVASNLGMLVSEKAHPVLNSLLGSIDIFSFWTVILLSIGLAAISNRKLTTKKSATVVVLLWVVWILAKAGWSALF